MNDILSVSEKASFELEKIIKKAPDGTVGILVGIENTGCNGYSYKMNFVKKNEVEDFEFVQKNKVKVYIEPKATMFLIGSQMDYSIDKLSSRFTFNNPNEKNTCGCGESFGI